jgi:hypothetical protein
LIPPDICEGEEWERTNVSLSDEEMPVVMDSAGFCKGSTSLVVSGGTIHKHFNHSGSHDEATVWLCCNFDHACTSVESMHGEECMYCEAKTSTNGNSYAK